jgi:addiction module RelB/DinJ family antitoxin
MSYTVVSTKVDPQTKKAAMETASELGMPLSVIIKAFLKQLIRTKTVTFSADIEEEPSAYMIESLKQSEADEKAGRVSPSFTNVKDAIAWLDDPNASYANGNKVRDKV